MRLNEIEQRYDVVVASKLGRFIEHKDLSAEAAKARLNDLVGDYQSDMFTANPRAGVEWTPNGEGAKLSDPDLGLVIFIYMSPTGMDNATRRERALTVDEDISKDEFHRKLADPAAQEIHDIVDELNSITRQHSFEAVVGEGSRFTTDREPADVAKIISTLTVPMGEEVREGNIAQAIRSRVERTDHWVWDTWDGDAEDVMFCYMIRKT